MSTVMTAGDGNEVTEGTVVVHEGSGDLGKITGFLENGTVRVIFSGRPGGHWVRLKDLNVAADQTWNVNVPWLEKPYDEWTPDEVGATPARQLAMASERELFARHGRLEEWERETRPVLWPDLMPEGCVPEAPASRSREERQGLMARIFGGRP